MKTIWVYVVKLVPFKIVVAAELRFELMPKGYLIWKIVRFSKCSDCLLLGHLNIVIGLYL